MVERRAAPGFKNIQFFGEHEQGVLGNGSYGKVYKVRCDDLVCAAKILHPTLFDPTVYEHATPQRGHRLPMERFERECEFMSALRHPNIVQYLGMFRDTNTGFPILVMELMDISLTRYLKNSTQPIPYHIQVNICHDVTLALSFLHSNNLIHRDLSSNNILLTKGATRAKVTDFGMAQLFSLNPHRINTMCPGTAVYMPPEALQGRPMYTEKIDCFSFGVIVLQVLTRQYPDPSDHQRKVEVNHPGMPRGQLMVCVPETDRRQNHISLVDPNYPLLAITLDCLRDNDGERPTAKQLCERVAVLINSSAYSESEKKANIQKGQELHRGREKDQTVAQLCQDVKYRDQVIKYKDQIIAKKGEENDQLRQQLDQAMHSYQIIQQQDRAIAEKERDIEQLTQQLEQANRREGEKDETDYRVLQQKEQMILQKQREIEQLAELLRQATDQDGEKEQRISQDREEIIARKNQEIRLLRIQLQQATVQDRAAAEGNRYQQKIDQVPGQQVQQVPVPKVRKKTPGQRWKTLETTKHDHGITSSSYHTHTDSSASGGTNQKLPSSIMTVFLRIKNHQIPPEVNHKFQLPPQLGARLLPHLQAATNIIALFTECITHIPTAPLQGELAIAMAPRLQNSATTAH